MIVYNKNWAIKRISELNKKIKYYRDRIHEKSKKHSQVSNEMRKGQNDINIMVKILKELYAEKEYLEDKYFPTPIPIWMFS